MYQVVDQMNDCVKEPTLRFHKWIEMLMKTIPDRDDRDQISKPSTS